MVEPLRDNDPTAVGQWHLKARIGVGGMGQVWLAADRDGRQAAVKTIRTDLADANALARFRREASAAAKVASPWTADVYEAGLDHDPPYLASEYVPGLTLQAHVERHGPLHGEQLVAFAAALADGLAAIHAVGVVHRDLSPRNIILSPDGPKIIDLGVAEVDGATRLTKTGLAYGTPTSMAPEQLTGGQVGPPADVFAWAVNVCFAATGHLPFGTGRPEAMTYRVVHDDPDLTGLSDEVLATVAAALAKEPSDRPTPTALTATLLEIPESGDRTMQVSQLVATAQLATLADVAEVATLATSVPPPRPRRWPAVAASLGLVAVAGTAAAFVWADRTATDTVAATADEPASLSDDEDDETTEEEAEEPPEASDDEVGTLGSLPLRLQQLAFDADASLCSPDLDAEIDGVWQISTATFPAPAGEPVEIGLRDKWGEHAGVGHDVTVTVIPPDRADAYDATVALEGEWPTVYYPGDFPQVDQPSAGTHTIIWRVDGRFAACHGFELTDPTSSAAPPTFGPGEPLTAEHTYLEPAGAYGAAPVFAAPANSGCENGDVDRSWDLVACAELDQGVVVVWTVGDVWRTVAYRYEGSPNGVSTYDTGPLERGYLAGEPALMTVPAGPAGDAVVVEFPSGGTAAVTDYEIIEAGGRLVAQVATSGGGLTLHDEGFLLDSWGEIQADIRRDDAGWRAWYR